MKFDIFRLDSAKVLQAIFKFAFVRRMGVVGDKANGRRPELSYEEAKALINANTKIIGDREIVSIDYVHGRPIKFTFDTSKNVVDSYPYDVRHGRYRFLYALLCEFGSNAVIIRRKNYPKDHVKPEELDSEAMIQEYKDYSQGIHYSEMKKNFRLN